MLLAISKTLILLNIIVCLPPVTVIVSVSSIDVVTARVVEDNPLLIAVVGVVGVTLLGVSVVC